MRALAAYPREAATVIGLTMGGTLAFYVYTTYVQKFLKLSAGLTDAQTTLISAGSLHLRHVPAAGLWRAVGSHRPASAAASPSACSAALFTVPLMTALQTARDPWTAFALVCAGWLIVGDLYVDQCAW